ncbi:hypothetical protein EHQ12_04110 [Leptospira gomenensis]|uniref:Uncharacterized protein n=1 Tax=Leptospira gomenensis TaxID=2484974 RepID=A0A5F1YDR1_9LEPT|nr:hypothetical protein [Leptospira gomenensis]TGK36201.1 hypothetical protein EHQ17_04610 [Leptospira gomenensis]TGK42761.1 hypothetical protein EHQ07_13890 [Leptospira gomenensis]TGK42949.1 hypothetical protein EHQ12_04110 [Leptospira gomenensis]TGK54960.1 hypothetical protein EHQ13_18365 [Leptospira gomenensis]
MQGKSTTDIMSDKANGRRIVYLLHELEETIHGRAESIGVSELTYRKTIYRQAGNQEVISDLTMLGIDHDLTPFDKRKERVPRWLKESAAS